MLTHKEINNKLEAKKENAYKYKKKFINKNEKKSLYMKQKRLYMKK